MSRVRTSVIVALAVLLNCQVGAQQPSAIQQEIQAVEDQWAKAYLTRDPKILDRILGAEYYIFSAWDGKKYTKADELKGAVTDPVTYSSVTNTVLEVKVYNDIVVALGVYAAKGTDAGKPVDQRGTWQTVFAKRNGQWVAVASHAAPDPKTK